MNRCLVKEILAILVMALLSSSQTRLWFGRGEGDRDCGGHTEWRFSRARARL
jgi:hypothetical protein